MNWVFGNYVRGRGAAGLLIVHFVFGLGIMLHGWQKIHSDGGPMGWMGPRLLPPLRLTEASHNPKSRRRRRAPVPGIPGFPPGPRRQLAEFSGGHGNHCGIAHADSRLWTDLQHARGPCLWSTIPKGDPFVAGPGQHGFEPAAGYLAVALLMLPLTGPGAVVAGRPDHGQILSQRRERDVGWDQIA